jgi:hypothetical protein
MTDDEVACKEREKKRARCGRRCTGLLILTDNWEEECCQSM